MKKCQCVCREGLCKHRAKYKVYYCERYVPAFLKLKDVEKIKVKP